MRQRLALEIMLSGQSVFLTGQAGAGKTFVLQEFIRTAKKIGKHVAVTATTGLAASHLGGNTIHSWSGLGIAEELPARFLRDLPAGRIDTITKTDVLIIDEISMLHDYRLDMIDQAARLVRQNDQPFGGLQVILCGDFFQLPPVNRDSQKQGGFAVHADVWQALEPVVCYLSEQHRQEDDVFLEILTALRANDIRRRHAEALLNRINVSLGDSPVTELHTTNVDVDSINRQALAALPGDSFVYTMHTTGSQNYVDQLKRSCLAPEELELKKGALVMCIKNSPDKKYVNGSLGTVVDFEEGTNYPYVTLRNGKTILIQPDSWELRDGTKKRAGLLQLPLRLAWAITVHKSQGMTLDAARIDLRKAFVEGMGYVALSRVKRLDALNLVGINRMALQVSADALQIDAKLQELSAVAQEQFSHLEKQAEARAAEAAKQKATPSGKRTIEELREKFPRAYLPWRADEDEKLIALFKTEKSVKKLAAALQRQPGGIRARLQKHFGEDVIFKA